MITNDHQRRTTERKLIELRTALEQRSNEPMPTGRDPEMHELVAEGLRAHITELQTELNNSHATHVELVTGNSLTPAASPIEGERLSGAVPDLRYQGKPHSGPNRAAVVRSAGPPAPGTGTGRGRSANSVAKVGLAMATLQHSPAQIDLSGTGLANAIADPDAEPHVKLISGWLAEFTSIHTRAAYMGDLLLFARYANTAGFNILNASKTDIAGFKAVLEDPNAGGLAPASVARRITAVSSFFNHCVVEEAIAANPALLVRRPRISDESMTQALTRIEAARLLEHAANAGPRDHALICLLMLNGLRVSEVCAANISDLHTVENHHVLKVRRKGGVVARTVLAPLTNGALRGHLDDRAVDGKPARGPLLIDREGQRLDRHDATRIVARLSRAIGVTKTITPHSLRHTFVTTARAANIDVRDVQAAVGHSDVRMTMRYDRSNQRLDAHPTYAVTTHLAATDTRNHQ
jgi:integrase/recombinase XerD